MTSPDLTEANIDKIADLFPSVVSETRDADGNPKRAIDFDQLRQELSDHVVEGPHERYQLDWPGKREAAFAANAPIAKTLRPVREESVDFDTTKNLFIEGDNLDALKLLQESYLGKVKLIYIDPPYNTGSDFVYDDDFAQSTSEYLARSGQIDELTARLVSNPETKGRFHSDWLDMIYPRLRLARNLLAEDGYIIVSIDDSEFSTMELLLDEVFGADNKLAVLVWDRNRKNDARFFSVGHEYMLVYARNKAGLTEAGVRLREPQPGVDEARDLFRDLKARFGEDWGAIQAEWRKWTKSFPADDERLKLGRFSKVGPRGPFRDDGNISWPGGGGPRYEVPHPITGQACKIPSRGWVFPTRARFDEAVSAGRVVFGPDHTTQPRILSYLFESEGLVMGSVHYSYAQTAAVDFAQIMGGKVFDNPKNWKDLSRLIDYLSGPGDIIIDFFAGSGSTAHAVLELNASTGSRRRFIMVQIAETPDPKSVAAESGYASIAEIGRDRIRRVGAAVREKLGLAAEGFDSGFRNLRVDSTNMADVLRTPDETGQHELADLESSVKPDCSGEDLLFQVLLDWGLELTMPIAVETIEGHEVFIVDDGALIACFDAEIGPELVRAIAHKEPLRAVFRDSSFASDDERINAEQLFRELSPSTLDVKVI
ncbi:site-specific DNA-methyltransferase [Mycobacterium sp. E802]|uniref:site-specific DNA-methyltransferase n=1 Tax=Mycobacterium sp. E802 TaxID=1834152 RepID=UPI0009ECCD48|nr:site-specific DNA-methyltransferase [Mycobacterium sp. E802]